MNQRPLAPLALAALLASAAATPAAAALRAESLAEPRDGETTFGLAVDLSLLEGRAKEHVFSPKADSADYAEAFGVPDDGRRHRISRLDWELESVGLVGLKGSVRRSVFSLNLGGWIGVGGEGDMKDYDWFAGDDLPYTEYSRSDADTTLAWMLDANLSADLFRNDAFAASAFLGFRVQHWEWECDGVTDYLYSDLDWKWVQDTGHVCDYEQELRFAYIGLSATWTFTPGFDLSGYAFWAPAYEAEDTDEHYAAEKTYRDDFPYDDGHVLGAGVELAWHFSARSTLALSVDWQKAALHEGDVSLDDYATGEHLDAEDAAGLENEYASATLSYRYSF